MKIFLDTEFNGFHGELISIGLIDYSGRSFYRVLECAEPVEWVDEHVMTVLGAAPITRQQLQIDLENWLSGYAKAHVIADWPEDIEHFCRLLITGPGTRINTPPLTMEVDRMLHSEKSEVPHNALFDARAIRHLYLEQNL